MHTLYTHFLPLLHISDFFCPFSFWSLFHPGYRLLRCTYAVHVSVLCHFFSPNDQPQRIIGKMTDFQLAHSQLQLPTVISHDKIKLWHWNKNHWKANLITFSKVYDSSKFDALVLVLHRFERRHTFLSNTRWVQSFWTNIQIWIALQTCRF